MGNRFSKHDRLRVDAITIAKRVMLEKQKGPARSCSKRCQKKSYDQHVEMVRSEAEALGEKGTIIDGRDGKTKI